MFRRSKTADSRRPRADQKRGVRSILSSEQFALAIARECCRVDRSGAGDLSMVLFRITKSRRWRLSTVRLIRTILSRIRVTDDIGWYDRDHLGILLPETSAAGAQKLAQLISDAVARHGPRRLFSLYFHPAQEQARQIPTGLVA